MRRSKWFLGLIGVVGGAIAVGCVTDPGAALEFADSQSQEDGTFRRRGSGGVEDLARGLDNGNANEGAENGNDNKAGGNGNDNGGTTNGNDNGGTANGNDNSVANGNDNGVANSNDNGGTTNSNDNGGTTNGNDNGAANANDNGGTANGNDNGAANGNANGTGATCADGSDRLRIDPMPHESRARWHRSASCRWFNTRTQDWPQSNVTIDVRVNGVVVAQMSIDSRGRGELTFDSTAGTMPAGFPDLHPGDVISLGTQSSGALQVDCSMGSGCGS